MARNLTSQMAAEMAAELVRPIFLWEGNFDSGPLRLWTGIGDLVWSGKTFTGAGNLVSIGEIEETEKTRATGLAFTLSGVPTSILDLVEGEDYQGRICQLWLGLLDSADAIVPDPYPLFRARMDVMTDEEDGETATVRLTAEHVLIDLERPRERRYTDEDQQLDHPGDRFLEFVPDLQEREIVGRER